MKIVWMFKKYNVYRILGCIRFSESLQYLVKNTELYLKYLRILFKDSIITPKMHYLSHYPDLIRKFGPLIRFSTKRFETKHYYFKQLITNLKSFKNSTNH
jgi:hypothetical protein